MDKLELDLDDLEVDSFQTDSGQEKDRGTVHGNEVTNYPRNCRTELDRTICYTDYDPTCDRIGCD